MSSVAAADDGSVIIGGTVTTSAPRASSMALIKLDADGNRIWSWTVREQTLSKCVCRGGLVPRVCAKQLMLSSFKSTESQSPIGHALVPFRMSSSSQG